MRTVSATYYLLVLTLSTLIAQSCHGATVRFTISHVNDVSGQIESFEKGTSNTTKAPKPCVTGQQLCVGGLLNVVHWLSELKSFEFEEIPLENRLTFSSGNLIGGESGWVPAIGSGWEKYAKAIAEYFNLTALALGQKEFGAGVAQATVFANNTNESVLEIVNTCNDGNGLPGIENEFCKIFNSPVKRVELKAEDGSSYKIGIVGFVSQLVERLSLPGKLKFSDVAEAIKQITTSVEYGDIETFIAVGDGNLELTKEIIDQSPKVKMVIYGSAFSNTKDMSQGDYPEPYKNSFIATAGRYGSSAGKIKLSIDTNTEEITVLKSGIVETKYPEDGYSDQGQLISVIASWRGSINYNTVGQARNKLESGDKCWRGECNLGNLMADAAVHCALSTGSSFTFPVHSIWHGGAFFEDDVAAGNVSEFDLHKWLPFHNNVHLVRVQGADLWNVFNASATGLDPAGAGKPDWRQFLQVSSGIRVYYSNVSSTPEVTRVRMLQDVSGVPRFADLEMTSDYYLAISTFLLEGRGVYDFAGSIWTELGCRDGTSDSCGFDDNCLRNYVKAMGQVSVGYEERILIDVEPGQCMT